MRNLHKSRCAHTRRNGIQISALVAILTCIGLCACCFPRVAFAESTDQETDNSSENAEAFSGLVMYGDTDVTQTMILEIQAYDTPYTFVVTPQGEADGYCTVNVSKDDAVTTKYIYPVTQPVELEIYAAANSEITFSFDIGVPEDIESVVEPVAFADGELEDGEPMMRAVLDISNTPVVAYTFMEPATLQDIATHYGVTEEDILTFNSLDSQQALYDGMELYIPDPITTEPYTFSELYYVEAGETLETIAQKLSVTVRSLRQWNNIYDATQLGAGTYLKIPVIYQPDSEMIVSQDISLESPESEQSETLQLQADSERMVGQDGTVYLNGVPLYFQNDYPDVLYGNGTVKTSGCSVTSLTMVANAITGYDYTVDELADYFGGVAENNIERLENGSTALGLKWERSENWDKTWEALQEGKIAIVMVDGRRNRNCLFSNDQHFIVLTGLNSEGRILVNDSNAKNYEVWNLQNGFENGFTARDILPGYSSAWVYDRTLETKPTRYTAYRPPKFDAETNNGGLTEQERYLLACLIWGEARGENIYGQQAVAEVVLNRLASGQFGSTISQVIRGEGQFNSVAAGQLEKATPTQAQYQAIDRALFGNRILPENVYYFALYAGKADVCIQIGNHLFSFDAP